MGATTALSYMSRWLIVTLPEHRDKIEKLLTEMNNVAVLTPASRTKVQIDQERLCAVSYSQLDTLRYCLLQRLFDSKTSTN